MRHRRFLVLTFAMILTDDICCSFAAFFISIVRRFSSRSSCIFSRSSSRTALLIMRLFSRSTSFSGLSRPNTLPIVVKLALCVTTVELVRLVRRLERDGDCAGERNDLIDSDWRFAQFTGNRKSATVEKRSQSSRSLLHSLYAP